MSQESAPSNESELSERIRQVLREAHGKEDGGIYTEESVKDALTVAGVDVSDLEISVQHDTGTDFTDGASDAPKLDEYVVQISQNGKQIFHDFYE